MLWRCTDVLGSFTRANPEAVCFSSTLVETPLSKRQAHCWEIRPRPSVLDPGESRNRLSMMTLGFGRRKTFYHLCSRYKGNNEKARQRNCWGECSSVVEHLTSKHEAMGSIPHKAKCSAFSRVTQEKSRVSHRQHLQLEEFARVDLGLYGVWVGSRPSHMPSKRLYMQLYSSPDWVFEKAISTSPFSPELLYLPLLR